MPNFDRAYGDDPGISGLGCIFVIVATIIYAVLSFSGAIKHDRCDPYYSGDELVSDCSDGEARESFEP